MDKEIFHERTLEDFMYQVMGRLAKMSAPLVFKGAMITKLILKENGYLAHDRSTLDIDVNWVGEPPSMERLLGIIKRSLEEYRDELAVEVVRKYTPELIAIFHVVNREDKHQIFRLDVDIYPVLGSKTYQHGEASFPGVLPDEVLCDKISVISCDRLLRRAKDMADLYALSRCLTVDTKNIFESFAKKPKQTLGFFDSFLNHHKEVKRAYNKLRGVVDKPRFDDVYSCLLVFLKPFITRDIKPKLWNHKELIWRENGDT
ncbi:MAG: nucleotidyl transferase AbiEii/AbiGii toxin family protein [Deltaproteobacteria bacterium]|jgi:hypothetical protein|nr:nucleotidyl transferase AbiEii/AbiGii toxin family protein [Deltaproteobacteria bacterium]